MEKTNKNRTMLYWAATMVSGVAFIIPGIGNLLHFPHFVQDMVHLGYPTYFPTLLGAWKIAGAIVILLPGLKRVKEWAYAGMLFDLTGASFSRMSAHDPIIMAVIPLAIGVIVLSSWMLRPENRKL
jgi:uncharacterized membrane protein YphA (DoxX/SURF4 family)